MQGSREGAEVRHLDPANAPYYLTIGDEARIFTAAYNARLPILLKGPTGCGKTRFVEHMAHQLASLDGRPERADYGRVPRGSDRQRSRRTLSDYRRRDGLGRRAVDAGRAPGRYLLSRRNRRSAQGHHRPDPSAVRPSAHPADREARRDARGACRLFAGDFVQSGLPEHPEKPEAFDPPAFRHDRIRLSAGGKRGRHHRARVGSRPRTWLINWPHLAKKCAI